jgi:hypothetical protein
MYLRILTSLGEGCISSLGWRLNHPTVDTGASASLKLMMEAYIDPVNGLLQPLGAPSQILMPQRRTC